MLDDANFFHIFQVYLYFKCYRNHKYWVVAQIVLSFNAFLYSYLPIEANESEVLIIHRK